MRIIIDDYGIKKMFRWITRTRFFITVLKHKKENCYENKTFKWCLIL